MRRINLFDAAVAGFVVVLIPIAYGTWLLFRPPHPVITAVRRVEITKEERRIGGPALVAKMKVQGSGFRPLLRATIGGVPAIGFVFENPNSADLLLGAIPAGSHDLILYDGVQEVARAPKAVRIQAPATSRLRLVGALIGLTRATADALKPGDSYATTTLIQLGPVRPDRRRMTVGAAALDLTMPEGLARDAEVSVPCDPDPTGAECTVGGQQLAPPTLAAGPPTVLVNGPEVMRFAVSEVLPDAAPSTATVKVRFDSAGEIVGQIKAGDRDSLLDDRAAVVTQAGKDATLRLGADAANGGWRYRGRDLRAGAPFTLTTPAYVVTGTVLSVSLSDKP